MRAVGAVILQPRAESLSVSEETAPWVAFSITHLRPVRATITASMGSVSIVALTGRRFLHKSLPGALPRAGGYLPNRGVSGAPRRCAPTTITTTRLRLRTKYSLKIFIVSPNIITFAMP